MDIYPDWIGPAGEGGPGETVYIEVPTSGLQGGRVLKNIIVKARIKLKRKKKIIKVIAKLLNR